nr:unnamed protein product [Digitaria exilis]
MLSSLAVLCVDHLNRVEGVTSTEDLSIQRLWNGNKRKTKNSVDLTFSSRRTAATVKAPTCPSPSQPACGEVAAAAALAWTVAPLAALPAKIQGHLEDRQWILEEVAEREEEEGDGHLDDRRWVFEEAAATALERRHWMRWD